VNDIYWQPKALRQLRKLDPKFSDQIRRAVSVELVDLKQAKQVKALTNHAFGYRLRVGNYRVFFNVAGVVHIAIIEEVRKRDERTY
jgi:mRNA interferase RelE/StbE